MGETFAAEIERVASGEPIEGIVIAPRETYRRDHRDEGVTTGQPLPWDAARPMLDYDYDRGFGGLDSHEIYAWTASRVLFVHEYDGSSRVNWLPRNPAAIRPHASGEDEWAADDEDDD